MTLVDPNSICASIEVDVPAEAAFEWMADGMNQTHWALGSMKRRALGDGLFVGESQFDGSDLYVKVVGHREVLMVDFWIGDSPETVTPGAEVRIREGEWLGLDKDHSVITMTIWKTADMDQDEWEFHWHLWRTEVRLIKGAIERGL